MAGAIPVIRPLTQSLAGDTVLRVAGSSTAPPNYISGWTTPAPAYDSGAGGRQCARAMPRPIRPPMWRADAAAKAAILASIAFRTRVTADDVYREGITKVTRGGLRSAKALGCTIKLLAICERITDQRRSGAGSARVYPGAGAAVPSAGTVSVRSTPSS